MKLKLAVALFLGLSSWTFGLTPGQTDDFQDGTTQSWTNGGIPPTPPVLNIATGGPGGAGDRYMQISSLGGGGAGNRLTVFNRGQWLGDFVGQGITVVEMDLNNLGDVDLSIRLGFKESIGPSTPGYVSPAFILPAGSGWTHVSFTIDMATMIALGSPAKFNTFFSGNFAEMRIIHSVNPDLNGDPIAAQLGIDNVHAAPEPGTLALMAIGLAAGAVVLRRKRKQSR